MVGVVSAGGEDCRPPDPFVGALKPLRDRPEALPRGLARQGRDDSVDDATGGGFVDREAP